MTATLAPYPFLQFFDANGNPLSFGYLYTYAAGTSTPLATYTDSTGSVANPNPVPLDAGGRAQIWMSNASYKFVLTYTNGSVVWTIDNIASPGGILNSLGLTDGVNGSNLVGFLQAGTGAVGRTVQSKLRDIVSALDFGVSSSSPDNTTAWSSACAAAQALGKPLYIPAGTYSGTLPTVTGSLSLIGEGIDKTVIQRTASATGPVFTVGGTGKVYLEGITFDGNRSNNSNAAHAVFVKTGLAEFEAFHCRFTGGKGYGVGLTIGDNNANKGSFGNHRATHCIMDNNDGGGVQITQENRVQINDCEIYNNGSSGTGTGIIVSYSVYPPVTDAQQQIVIHRNQIYNNGGSGVFVFGSVTGGTSAEPIFGIRPNANQFVSINSNQVYLNYQYGIIAQADGIGILDNICNYNGSYSSPQASAFGGITCNSGSATVTGNVCIGNSGFGIDMGGSGYFTCSNNYIGLTGSGGAGGFIGLNLGACQYGTVVGNILESNGPSSTGVNIMVPGYDGGVNAFASLTTDLHISDNTIICGGVSTRAGIQLYGGPTNISVTDNHIQGGAITNNILIQTNNAVKCEGNVSDQASMAGIPMASAAGLVIPDWSDTLYLTGAATVTNIQTNSQSNFFQSVCEVIITNGGSGYNPASPPTVTFSGGGGTGATGIANVSGAGAVVSVTVTNKGSGYTSAPTIAFGSGSAAATAVVGCNNVYGKKLTIHCGSAITWTNGNNIVLPTSTVSSAANSVIDFLGFSDGTYHERSRTS